MRKIIYLIVLIVLTLGCNMFQEERKFSKEGLDHYNNKIIQGENENAEWVKLPLTIAIKLARASLASDITEITFRRINTGELTTEVQISINEKGYLEHPGVNPYYNFFFHLKKVDGKWRVVAY